jgi:ribosomal protein S18 acetylase RimI-like enzyme
MNLEFRSMADYGLEPAAEVMARAFEDYFVRIPSTVPVLLNMARTDSVDLTLSCVFLCDGQAVGGALIARRGWTCRLAGMGIVPKARRAGAGRSAMVHLLTEAKARGDRMMLLEVIEQNIAAVELYRAFGFKEIRRLVGFAGPPPSHAVAPADLIEVDLPEVAAAVRHHGLPNLPWQLSSETLAQLTPPSAAYRMDGAWIALTDPSQPVVTIRALVAARDKSVGRDSVEPGDSREATLLRAVMAKHPGKQEWRLSAVWPEELAPSIAPAGLPRTALTQWQMQRAV